MNWITQVKRLSIYLRDGLACAYCGHSVENGAQLTLDHLKPHSNGGTNHETNLVTGCQKCNSSRGNRPLATFVKAVAVYRNHGVKADDILRHVRNASARVLKPFKADAAAMIERRGSVAKALAKF